MQMLRFTLSLLLVLIGISSAACSSTLNHVSAGAHSAPSGDVADTNGSNESSILDIRQISSIDGIAGELAKKRIVHIGESHVQYNHHIAQLDIIKALHKAHPDLAIGMEMFQQPYQQYLDQYIAGELDEAEMLRNTEYFTRWQYDFRLYQPILNYARENGIPVIALNIEKEITSKVGDVGIDGLDEDEKRKIPEELDDSSEKYRENLKKVYAHHPRNENSNFERFLQVQLLWDEGMAERAAGYLQEHPNSKMVVLAGLNHVAYGLGIPDRVTRRLPVDSAIVLPGDATPVEPGIGDFIIYPRSAELPPAGLMGIFLGQGGDEGVEAKDLAPEGAAATAGVRKGDKIYQINDTKITSRTDIKLALLNMQPGEEITLHINRRKFLWGNRQLEISFELGG